MEMNGTNRKNLEKNLVVINEIIINWTLVVKRDPPQIIKKFDKSIHDSIEISAPLI